MAITTPVNNFHRREQLAWAILVGSFFACLLLTLAVPLGLNAVIQNTTIGLDTTVQANQGTVGIDDASGVRSAALVGEAPQAIEQGSRILTDASASAIMLIGMPNVDQLLARITIDSNTSVALTRATTPRFQWSRSDQRMELTVDNGRILLTFLETDGSPAELSVATPQGTILIRDAGQYSVDVNNEQTQVVVQEGTATAVAANQVLELTERQRAVIPTEQAPIGPFTPARNLVRNGAFDDSFEGWAQYTWKVELPDQPKGRTDITEVDGEPVLRFERGGVGHADARVRQSIDANVADYESLRLLMTLRIQSQSLGVCGIQGSECPLFVRMEYVDANGVDQVWQHGFYATGEVNDNTTPGACISCAVIQSNHERVPLGQDYFYEVDLREELARQGALPPSFVKSISLIASGHSFITDVVDVALVVEE